MLAFLLVSLAELRAEPLYAELCAELHTEPLYAELRAELHAEPPYAELPYTKP